MEPLASAAEKLRSTASTLLDAASHLPLNTGAEAASEISLAAVATSEDRSSNTTCDLNFVRVATMDAAASFLCVS